MTEPDVTITNFALVILNAIFAWRIHKTTFIEKPFQRLWMMFFASIALAAFTGGLVHGFLMDASLLANRIIWPTTILFVGVTALSCWWLGFYLIASKYFIKKLNFLALLTFILYVAIVILHRRTFNVAIVYYLPAAMFLLIAITWFYQNNAFYQEMTHLNLSLMVGACGITITLLAALGQQRSWAIHPKYFTYNATYHLIQGIGLAMLFFSAKRFKGWQKVQE
jgi:hypothetical protein